MTVAPDAPGAPGAPDTPDAPRTDDSDGADTVPFGDSHFERLRKQGILQPGSSNQDADEVPELGPYRDATPKTMGLNQLQLEQAPHLRVLFQQPEHGVHVTLTAEQTEEFDVGAPGTRHELPTKVLGAMHSRAGATCSCKARRIKVTLFFIPWKDDVILYNETDSPLFLESVPNRLIMLEIMSKEYAVVHPGFWQLRDDETAVEFLLRPRRYCLLVTDEAVKRSAGQPALSSKRPKHSAEGARTGAGAEPPPLQDNVQKTIIRSSPADVDLLHRIGLSENQTLNIVDGVTGQLEYSIKRIGRYLQRNKHADVLKAIWDDGSSGPAVVAVKMHKIPTTEPYDTAAAIKRWDREIRAHRSLDHPRIAKLLAFDSRLLALVVEHQDSYDLGTPYWCPPSGWFKGTADDACCIVADVSSALAYLAEQGLVHNDIKAGNILYRAVDPTSGINAGAVLVDFGLSRIIKNEPWDLGGGAPWYLPPEWIARGKREPPADIFSLGVVMLYVLRCIRLPDKKRGWDVNAIQQQTAEAIDSMNKWLAIVKSHCDRLQDPGVNSKEAKLRLLVQQMLSARPSARITACELASQTREWAA